MFGYGLIRIENQSWKYNLMLEAELKKVVNEEDKGPWSNIPE